MPHIQALGLTNWSRFFRLRAWPSTGDTDRDALVWALANRNGDPNDFICGPGSASSAGRLGFGAPIPNPQPDGNDRLGASLPGVGRLQSSPSALSSETAAPRQASRSPNTSSILSAVHNRFFDSSIPPQGPPPPPLGWRHSYFGDAFADSDRGSKEAERQFWSDLQPSGPADFIESASPVGALRQASDTLDLTVKPFGYFVGGLARPFLPDWSSSDRAAAAQINRQIPWFDIVHRRWDPQAVRDAGGVLAVGLPVPEAEEARAAVLVSGPLREGEIVTYRLARALRGNSGLVAHEIWQFANQKAVGLAFRRLTGEVSRQSPVVMLSREMHARVTALQRAIAAHAQTPAENIQANIDLVRELGVMSDQDMVRLHRFVTGHSGRYGH